MHRKAVLGFTLAELLIALAILGEIAAFTIPKIISSQQNGAYNAKATEAFSMVASAYKLYKLSNTATGSTPLTTLTSYMNYTNIDSTSLLD